MQKDIQPKMSSCKYTCASCGATYEIQSTKGGNIAIDVCSECHPFYVGAQTNASLRGRAEKLSKKFEIGKGYSNKKQSTAKTSAKKADDVKRGFESL